MRKSKNTQKREYETYNSISNVREAFYVHTKARLSTSVIDPVETEEKLLILQTGLKESVKYNHTNQGKPCVSSHQSTRS